MIYNIFVNFRKVCDEYAHESDLSSTPGMITTRDAQAITRYIKHNSKSVESIIDENSEITNYVKTYAKRINSGDSEVYFMKYKDSNKKNVIR